MLKPGPFSFEEDYDDDEIDESDSFGSYKTIVQNDESFFGNWIKSLNDIFQGIFSESDLIEDSKGVRTESGSTAALIQNMNILWIKNFENIKSMKVIDNGISVVSHYNFLDFTSTTKISEKDLGGTVDVFDNKGDVIFSQTFTSNVGVVEISYNGKYLLASTLHPDSSIYCIDLPRKKQIWKYQNNVSRQVTGLKFLNNVIHVYCGRSKSEEEIAFHLDLNGVLDTTESVRQEKIEKIYKKTNADEKVNDFLLLLNTEKTFELTSALGGIRSLCGKAKKSHTKILQNVLPLLDPSNEELFHTGWSVVRSIMAKSPEIFDEYTSTVLKILKMPSVEENSRLFYYQHMAQYIPKSLEGEIPYLGNIVKHGENWNDRRFAISVLGILGSKNPDSVKEFMPILQNYIESTEKIKKLVQMKKEDDIIHPTPDIPLEIGLKGDVDGAVWVMDASIDAIGDIGSAKPELVSECVPILKELSEKSKNKYTKEKAKQALEKINK